MLDAIPPSAATYPPPVLEDFLLLRCLERDLDRERERERERERDLLRAAREV